MSFRPRDLLRLRGRRTPAEKEPPAPSPRELLAARDAQWNALLAQYDVRERDDKPRKFSPLLIDNAQRKCFRMREEDGVRVRIQAECEGGDE